MKHDNNSISISYEEAAYLVREGRQWLFHAKYEQNDQPVLTEAKERFTSDLGKECQERLVQKKEKLGDSPISSLAELSMELNAQRDTLLQFKKNGTTLLDADRQDNLNLLFAFHQSKYHLITADKEHNKPEVFKEQQPTIHVMPRPTRNLRELFNDKFWPKHRSESTKFNMTKDFSYV